MKLEILQDGTLQIDDARICYRNFAGVGNDYNREGERNFSVIIPNQDVAEILMNDTNEHGVGWNVRIKPPRNEDEDPFMHLPVKIKFRENGPHVYLQSGRNRIKLDENSIHRLDKVSIASVSLDIRPNDSVIRGTAYRTAYLHAIKVVQRINDRFADEDEEY